METFSERLHEHGSQSAQGGWFETLEQLEHDLNDLVDAFALLGIKRCTQCRKFFRSTEPGALFDSGELICFSCVPKWWRSLSETLRVDDRERIEAKLSSWLRKYHNAEVLKEERGKSVDAGEHAFEIVVHCTECQGSGKLLEGERCRFCNGLGTVRIVVPK